MQLQTNTPLHYQFTDDLPKDAYFEMLNIGPGVELCFTDDFEYPENVKCKKSLNQSGKFNITEANFLVQSQVLAAWSSKQKFGKAKRKRTTSGSSGSPWRESLLLLESRCLFSSL
ncbi:Hypothetical_protein [Hexamita inflata]|uniref:Hypothetical_protein n=1 Tax=Hexamita inflata TaxID=28002 RepID=A0ABP1H6F5_9EUKA